MKKIKFKVQFIIASLLLVTLVNAQTISTTDQVLTSGDIGTTILVPINTSDIATTYPNLYSVTITVEFDESVMTYDGYTDFNSGLLDFPEIVVNPAGEGGVVQFNFLDEDNAGGTAWTDGLLANLQFTFLGGQSDIMITEEEFFAVDFNLYYPTVVNGSVDGGFYSTTIDGGDWETTTDWSTGVVPNSFANVTVLSGTETTTSADASANSVTINAGGKLTLSTGNTLTVTGDFLVESGAGGNGSFINNGTLTAGTTTVESYVTGGVWHGISTPVSGILTGDLMIGGTDVYLQEHDEQSNTYSYVTSTTKSLGALEGYFTWIDGSANTYSFSGNLNEGTPSTDVTKSITGFGYNFVGNPWTSAIDWEVASALGGSSTITDNVWVYDGSTFLVYNRTTNLGDARYIAMNQGFFIEAVTSGTFTMTNGLCVHNSVAFRNPERIEQQTITLELLSNGMSDKTYVVFKEGATQSYEGTFDAHKLFSFNEDYPQIYSTANDFMAINSLPYDYRESIAIDVRGEDGNEMTISALETADLDAIYLKDEATGNTVDLTKESYTFTYDASITNRFTILFGITDINENPEGIDAKVFASNGAIQVMLNDFENVDINVFNILGQNVASKKATGTNSSISVQQSGYYLVKLSNGTKVSAQKVFIK